MGLRLSLVCTCTASSLVNHRATRNAKRSVVFYAAVEDEWELEARRCPRTTDGLNVLAVRSVLSPHAAYVFRAPYETDMSMYERAGEVLASIHSTSADHVAAASQIARGRYDILAMRYGFLLSFPNLKFRKAIGRARDNKSTETAGGVRAERHDAGSRLANDIKSTSRTCREALMVHESSRARV